MIKSHNQFPRHVLGPILLGVSAACAFAGCAPQASNTVAINAYLVRDPDSAESANGPRNVVLSHITVRDANSKVIASPRIMAEVGQKASVTMTSSEGAINVDVLSRTEGDRVVVDAVLKDGQGTHVSSTTASAENPPPPQRS